MRGGTALEWRNGIPVARSGCSSGPPGRLPWSTPAAHKLAATAPAVGLVKPAADARPAAERQVGEAEGGSGGRLARRHQGRQLCGGGQGCQQAQTLLPLRRLLLLLLLRPLLLLQGKAATLLWNMACRAKISLISSGWDM
jgi:hypothetical protein